MKGDEQTMVICWLLSMTMKWSHSIEEGMGMCYIHGKEKASALLKVLRTNELDLLWISTDICFLLLNQSFCFSQILYKCTCLVDSGSWQENECRTIYFVEFASLSDSCVPEFIKRFPIRNRNWVINLSQQLLPHCECQWVKNPKGKIANSNQIKCNCVLEFVMMYIICYSVKNRLLDVRCKKKQLQLHPPHNNHTYCVSFMYNFTNFLQFCEKNIFKHVITCGQVMILND